MSRMDRINQFMKREISSMIQNDLQDPRLQFVTITNVDVSRDLSCARVHFSALGGAQKEQSVLAALNSAKGLIRKMIGQRIRLRLTPDLEFFYDKSIEYSSQIEQALEEIRNENKKDH